MVIAYGRNEAYPEGVVFLMGGELIKDRLIDGFQTVAVMVAGEPVVEGVGIIIQETGGGG
jgi:hypothetical protein